MKTKEIAKRKALFKWQSPLGLNLTRPTMTRKLSRARLLWFCRRNIGMEV